MREAPACLKSFAVDLFLVSDLRAGDADAHLSELNAMYLIGPQGTRSHVAALNCQRQGGYTDHIVQPIQNDVHNDLTHNGQQRQSEFYNGMTLVDLLSWLINHGVFRHEIDLKSAVFIFELYKPKDSQTN